MTANCNFTSRCRTVGTPKTADCVVAHRMSQADGSGKDGALQWMYEGNSGHTAEDVLTGKVRLDATDVRKSVGLQKDNEKELYSSSSSSFIGSSMLGARATTLDIPRRG